jgi:hypothetical protein
MDPMTHDSDRSPLGSLGLQELVREEWAFLPSEGDEPGRVFDLEAARRGCPAAVAKDSSS